MAKRNNLRGRAESETTELLQKNNQNMTADSENVKIFGI